MGDAAVRLAIVLAAALLVAALAFAMRHRRGKTTRSIAVTGLEPGAYLFTSATCATCSAARSALEGYVEISWEERPEVFDRLGVAAVPSTLLVDASGAGFWRAWSLVGGNP